MRLTELEPRWFTQANNPDIVGITFNCPCCNGKTRLGILFIEEIDRDKLPNDTHWSIKGIKWHREGETFETISLTPSIDASKWGHWHGHITNGQVQ